jgi:hypothetical protein
METSRALQKTAGKEMTRHVKSEPVLGHGRSSQALRFIAVLATAALAFSTAAFAQSEEQVTAGLAAWRSSGCKKQDWCEDYK